MTAPPVILASQSPRRAQLLRMLGIEIETMPADIDETLLAGEEPGAHAERLAREKALAIAGRRRDCVIIGSDTVVAVDGDVLGKPVDAEDAVRMLMRLQGRTHEVITGVAVWRGALYSAAERVRVRFVEFDERQARAYAETGEPLDKAGAYGIQGYGATLVEGIDGDYYAVMGLPIVQTLELLRQAGLRYRFAGLEPLG